MYFLIDPYELNNLAADPRYQDKKAELKKAMHQWILDSRDAGFLFEPEMMMRGASSTVYEMARDSSQYYLPHILAVAEMVGKADIETTTMNLTDHDSGVRFWALMNLRAMANEATLAIESIKPLLQDKSPSVAILAA
ncbi:MAG: hypothetical protein ACOCXH_00990 [Cyclobacteriaceae bacterium]